MKKHYISVLAVFKNEASFMPSWLRHYFDRGIDHMYLLDDGSEDEYMESLAPFVDEGRVTLKHVDGDDDRSMEWRQTHLYNKYFGQILEETFWLGVFDLDEYVYSPASKDISGLLKTLEPEQQQEVVADWYWFGSNGLDEQPEDIVGSFVMRASRLSREYKYEKEGYHRDWCCKSFGKTALISKIRHHFNDYSWSGANNFCTFGRRSCGDISLNLSDRGMLFVNHYVGAKNYYMKKRFRGDVNNSGIARDEAMYDLINKNEVLDDRLARQNSDI